MCEELEAAVLDGDTQAVSSGTRGRRPQPFLGVPWSSSRSVEVSKRIEDGVTDRHGSGVSASAQGRARAG